MKLDYTSSDLSQRITILKRRVVKDAKMNAVETFTRLKTVWAYVEVRAALNASYEQIQHGVTRYFMVIRWDDELFRNIDAIEYGGNFLRLVSPPYKGERKFIVINCRELDLDEKRPPVAFPGLP